MFGCHRLMNIGKEPAMSQGVTDVNKVTQPNIRTLKMPTNQRVLRDKINAQKSPKQINKTRMMSASLWQSGPESLFGDRRAENIGDILTVNIEIDDRAEVDNRTERTRDSSDEASINAGFGIDNLINKNLPSPLSVTPGLNATGTHATTGEGRINRRERIELKIAALVMDVLPNGNFIIQGSQEVNVNYELRDLQISGIVRPQDISRKNTIDYDKIAEARIYYGGRGNVSDLQQPRYGSQLFDIISPF